MRESNKTDKWLRTNTGPEGNSLTNSKHASKRGTDNNWVNYWQSVSQWYFLSCTIFSVQSGKQRRSSGLFCIWHLHLSTGELSHIEPLAAAIVSVLCLWVFNNTNIPRVPMGVVICGLLTEDNCAVSPLVCVSMLTLYKQLICVALSLHHIGATLCLPSKTSKDSAKEHRKSTSTNYWNTASLKSGGTSKQVAAHGGTKPALPALVVTWVRYVRYVLC